MLWVDASGGEVTPRILALLRSLARQIPMAPSRSTCNTLSILSKLLATYSVQFHLNELLHT